MAVNRHKKHLVVFVEDKPYSDILNGVQMVHNINMDVIDVKSPCGGWTKVFESFEKNKKILDKFPEAIILLIMDFDDKKEDTESSFENRKNRFNELVEDKYKHRVFLLGTNHKESEDLKKIFSLSNFEAIGKILVEDCPNGNLANWNNKHLNCNLSEIDRMKKAGVFDWLFS